MTLKKKLNENIVEKGENDGNQHFSFSTVFSNLPKTKFNFILSSANALNFDLSKILSFGKF